MTAEVVGSDALHTWWYDGSGDTSWVDGLRTALRADGARLADYADGDHHLLVAAGVGTVPDAPEGVEHDHYRLVGSGGRSGEDAPYLFAVRVRPTPDGVQPLREWLHGEHFPRQVTTSGISWGHGYESTTRDGYFLNLWGIADPGVPDRAEYVAVRATPWYERITPVFASAEVSRSVLSKVAPAEIARPDR